MSLCITGLKISYQIRTIVLRSFSISQRCAIEEDVDVDGLPKDYKVKKLRAGSRRLDTLINRATGKSSSQVEKMILGGRVRINEEVNVKKAYNVNRDDSIDIWNRSHPENGQLAEVERIEIDDYELTDKGYEFNVKIWKKFLVENWKI